MTGRWQVSSSQYNTPFDRSGVPPAHAAASSGPAAHPSGPGNSGDTSTSAQARERMAHAPGAAARRLHLHALWYPRSRMQSNIDGAAFDGHLSEAYQAMHDALAATRDTVSAGHLWVETEAHAQTLAQLAAAAPDDRVQVQVHTKEDLATMTAAQPPDVRRLLERLQAMPATENIGLRADIERMVYGIAYEAAVASGEDQINAHVDVDTLRALAHMPRDPAGHHGAGDVAEAMGHLGFAAPADRNDLLFMRPGHPDAVHVAEKMLHVLRKGDYPLDPGAPQEVVEMAEQWQTGVRFMTGLLNSLATGAQFAPGGAVTSGEMMKRFMMADALCKQRGAVQARVDALVGELGSIDPASRRAGEIRHQVVGIGEVFRSSAQMIESYVNLCVYLPQIEHASHGGAQAADSMCRRIFGGPLPPAGADTWRAGTLNIPEELRQHGLAPQEFEAALKAGFAELRPLIRPMLL